MGVTTEAFGIPIAPFRLFVTIGVGAIALQFIASFVDAVNKARGKG